MNGVRHQDVHRAWGSGRWFPGDRGSLSAKIEVYLRDANVDRVEGAIQAAIAPHAGFDFSGPVAGYTFRAIQAQAESGYAPATVVVLGFGHRTSFSGVAFMGGTGIETPLGVAPLDREAREFLTGASGRLHVDDTPHSGEHSAENEIPFVQVALPDARLVVGLIGDHDDETLQDLLDALVRLAHRKALLVLASTDLLHDPDYERVTRTDQDTLRKITALQDGALADSWSYSNQFCCGIGGVLTAVRFARAMGCRQGRLLRYRNSGDDFPEGRGEWVVGYGSVVFPRDDV